MRRRKHTVQPTPPDAASQPREPTAFPIEPAMPSRTSDSVLLTLDEVAAALGMSKKSVQRRIKAGLIRKAPLGGRLVRISSDEVRRLAGGGLILGGPEDADPD